MEIAFIIFIVIVAIVVSVIKLSAASSKTKESDEERREDVRKRSMSVPEDAFNAQVEPMRRITEQRNNVGGDLSLGHHESHCDVDSHEIKDKYRVEKVPVMNSIGGKSSEGCREHYDLRFVKEDKQEPEKKLELTELQKIVVYGEIINNPAFRRNGYRKIR